MSSQQIAPDIRTPAVPPKSMAGKYDGRVKANKSRSVKPSGRKPAFAKHLTRNTAAHVLKQASAKELWLQLLGASDMRLRFEVLRYLTDRLEGKPFVASNPKDDKPGNPILNDNRIQTAIFQLVPAKQARKSKKANQIEANGEAKQLVSGDQAEQGYVDATAQVVDSGQDVAE